MGTLSRLYSPYGAHKLLWGIEPEKYNRGDLVAPAAVWERLQKEFEADPPSHIVYKRSLSLLPMLHEAHETGILLDQSALKDLDASLPARFGEIQRHCQAMVGWPLNLASPKQVAHWLYKECHLPAQHSRKVKGGITVGEDALDRLAKQYPDDPVITARLAYAAVKQLHSHYVAPLLGKERAYPRFSIHTQTSGRWSTTDPPLATLPRDGSMDHIFLPDPGEAWLTYDIDKAELWIMAAEADETRMLETLRSGQDIHTVNTLALLGLGTLPEDWAGKQDERRTMGKNFTHRLDYLGDPRRCGDLPGIRRVLGDTPGLWEKAARAYFARYPALPRYHKRMTEGYRRTWTARSWDGRRRVSCARTPAAIRELMNHPFQAGVAGVFDVTTLQIYATLKHMDAQSRFIFQAHDSATWGVPRARVSAARRIIEDVFGQTFVINGHEIVFPIEWKETRDGE